MFTGIVTAIGTVAKAQQRGDLRLRITAPFDPARIDIGASVRATLSSVRIQAERLAALERAGSLFAKASEMLPHVISHDFQVIVTFL